MTTVDEIRQQFEKLSAALSSGDLDGFYALMHDDAVVLDEDIPFLGGKRAFQNHIDWHVSGIWEYFAWVPRYPRFNVSGDTGCVAGNATFRGKPIDSGFRQRHLIFTQGWARIDGRWLLITWHQSTIDGHVLDASPG